MSELVFQEYIEFLNWPINIDMVQHFHIGFWMQLNRDPEIVTKGPKMGLGFKNSNFSEVQWYIS